MLSSHSPLRETASSITVSLWRSATKTRRHVTDLIGKGHILFNENGEECDLGREGRLFGGSTNAVQTEPRSSLRRLGLHVLNYEITPSEC